jgi:hypothetical protein
MWPQTHLLLLQQGITGVAQLPQLQAAQSTQVTRLPSHRVCGQQIMHSNHLIQKLYVVSQPQE